MKNIIVLLTVLLSLTKFVSGQRIENLQTRERELFVAGVLNKEMSYGFYYTKIAVNKTIACEFITYDKNLKEIKHVEGSLPATCFPTCAYEKNGKAYVLAVKSLTGEFILMEFDGNTIKETTGFLPKKCYARDMVAGNSKAIVRMESNKYKGGVLALIDCSTSTVDTIIIGSTKSKDVYTDLGIQYIDGKDEFFATYVGTNRESQSLYLYKFDKSFKKSTPILLHSAGSKERHIVTAELEYVNNKWFVIGNYANSKLYSSYGVYANHGFYIGELNDDKLSNLKFYSWANDMSHFTDYLSDRNKDRTERKIDKSNAKGEELEFLVSSFVSHLSFVNGTYMMVMELYYPTTSTYTDQNGRVTSVFAGYVFPQALVIGFDEQLKKMWDLSFPIGINTANKVYGQVKVDQMSTSIICRYVSGNVVKQATYSTAGTKSDESSFSFTLHSAGERVTAVYNSQILYWSDGVYLGCGVVSKKGEEGKGSYAYLTVVKDKTKK